MDPARCLPMLCDFAAARRELFLPASVPPRSSCGLRFLLRMAIVAAECPAELGECCHRSTLPPSLCASNAAFEPATLVSGCHRSFILWSLASIAAVFAAVKSAPRLGKLGRSCGCAYLSEVAAPDFIFSIDICEWGSDVDLLLELSLPSESSGLLGFRSGWVAYSAAVDAAADSCWSFSWADGSGHGCTSPGRPVVFVAISCLINLRRPS